VDLVVLAMSVHVEAAALRAVLDVQTARRRLQLPVQFTAPDLTYWGPHYAQDVRRMPEGSGRGHWAMRSLS